MPKNTTTHKESTASSKIASHHRARHTQAAKVTPSYVAPNRPRTGGAPPSRQRSGSKPPRNVPPAPRRDIECFTDWLGHPNSSATQWAFGLRQLERAAEQQCIGYLLIA